MEEENITPIWTMVERYNTSLILKKIRSDIQDLMDTYAFHDRSEPDRIDLNFTLYNPDVVFYNFASYKFKHSFFEEWKYQNE